MATNAMAKSAMVRESYRERNFELGLEYPPRCPIYSPPPF